MLTVAVGMTVVEAAVLAAAGVGTRARWVDWAAAWWVVLPTLPIGWSFLVVGLFAWRRRPANRVGVLMIAVGFGELASGMWMVPLSVVFTAGLVVALWFLALLVHLLLAFPSGRLTGRAARGLVAGGYLIVLPGNAVLMMVLDGSGIGPPGVHDLLLVHVDEALAGVVSLVSGVLTVALLTATAVVLAWRWRRGSEAQQRALSPVLVAGALFTVLTGARLAFPGQVTVLGTLVTMVAIPYAFVAGLIRIQFFQMAMDNRRLQDELRARVLELEHSRADVIRAGEAQRRQLERNLHDGAQQLLIGLRLRLGLIRQSLSANAAADSPGTDGLGPDDLSIEVDTAMSDLDAALAELRELAHGLHPMLLSTRGLAAAVVSLAERAPVPVQVDVRVRQRLPQAIETATYFVIAEGLTNIAKHAAATSATVTVTERPGRLLVEILDDGTGGADVAGSGLRGLAARVAALDGHVEIRTPARSGTLIRALIPLPADGPADRPGW
jgi:signal transduction histidine kinase